METVFTNLKEQLTTQGFVIFREPEIANLVQLAEDFQFLNREERLRDNGEKDLPTELNKRLTLAAQFLQEKYLTAYWPECIFRKFVIWEGVDKDNQYWHTDAFEDMDLFFLYYFDDTFAATGGGIHFRWNDKTFQHQPLRGDLILVSNQRGFFHRADDSKIKRRAASFDFFVNGDN